MLDIRTKNICEKVARYAFDNNIPLSQIINTMWAFYDQLYGMEMLRRASEPVDESIQPLETSKYPVVPEYPISNKVLPLLRRIEHRKKVDRAWKLANESTALGQTDGVDYTEHTE